MSPFLCKDNKAAAHTRVSQRKQTTEKDAKLELCKWVIKSALKNQ